MSFLRFVPFVLLMAAASSAARADDILFIGNSFTLGSSAPQVINNGGVPKLFEAIARAEGKSVVTSAVAVGGKDWTYHLAQPETSQALVAKTWNWVVLQDVSTRPTRIGSVQKFLQDGETFSDKIGQTSPHAGIILYETWARPPGAFYKNAPGNGLTGPEQMMSDLHQSYGRLHDDLAARNPGRKVRVALVGTAFARVNALYPDLNLLAPDKHHANNDGYYLAALVLYETTFDVSCKGAPTTFYNGALVIPANDAAKLQEVADAVEGGTVK